MHNCGGTNQQADGHATGSIFGTQAEDHRRGPCDATRSLFRPRCFYLIFRASTKPAGNRFCVVRYNAKNGFGGYVGLKTVGTNVVKGELRGLFEYPYQCGLPSLSGIPFPKSDSFRINRVAASRAIRAPKSRQGRATPVARPIYIRGVVGPFVAGHCVLIRFHSRLGLLSRLDDRRPKQRRS